MTNKNFVCLIEADADCEFEFDEATGPNCDCNSMVYEIASSGGSGPSYLTSSSTLVDSTKFSTLETSDVSLAGEWE